MEGQTLSDIGLNTRPQFPSFNKMLRLARNAHRHYMQVSGQAKFPPLPYWKLLKPETPVAPVPIDVHRAPTATPVEAFNYPKGQVPLSDPLTLINYPQPPDELHETPTETTVVDVFGEAEWDRMRFKSFVCPAFVKVQHTAQLTKFGKVVKTEGDVHISRFILELIGLEPGSGDLFQWDGKLRIIAEAIERYGYVGTTDYWTWLKCPYLDFHGDSSNLNLPALPSIEVPALPDEQ